MAISSCVSTTAGTSADGCLSYAKDRWAYRQGKIRNHRGQPKVIDKFQWRDRAKTSFNTPTGLFQFTVVSWQSQWSATLVWVLHFIWVIIIVGNGQVRPDPAKLSVVRFSYPKDKFEEFNWILPQIHWKLCNYCSAIDWFDKETATRQDVRVWYSIERSIV